MVGRVMRYWLGAGDSGCWDDPVHVVCSSQCMLYSLYAVPGVCCTWCSLLIMAWRDKEGGLNFVFLGDGRVVDEQLRDERRWDQLS
jgi:hypothetical protein